MILTTAIDGTECGYVNAVIVDKLAGALEKAMRDPSIVAAVEKSGMVVDYHAPQATQKMLDGEAELVRNVVQKLNLGKK